MMRSRAVAAAVLGALALAVPSGCAASPASPSDSSLVGVWGGDHVTFAIEGGGAHLEFDCAHGDIETSIELDAQGAFLIQGVFVRERGGPVREGEPPDAHPVTYAGTVTRTRMLLTVRLDETNEVIGTFTLDKGAPGRVVKCL
jgi:hypothetical protein